MYNPMPILEKYDLEVAATVSKELARQRYMKTFESFRINMYAMMLKKLDTTIEQVVKRLNFSCARRAERENIIADMTARAE